MTTSIQYYNQFIKQNLENFIYRIKNCINSYELYKSYDNI